MNTEHQHSENRANDLPIAESTQIEKIAKTPLKRLRLTLANRFGLHSNSNSPSIQTPPAKRNTPNTPSSTTSSATSTTLNKLDPQVYLDTQSNGFASRVVKYHEASEAKTRDIANKTYRRLGDFPIVNLDKSEINLNQKQANAPQVSKIHIAPPINLVSASARSAIFRTGKNYGDSYPMGPIGKIGPIEGRKPIRTSISQDEPIVPSTNDYDGGSARSSLEALKEISRKRIHCDEIDGEVNKKQRAENAQDECDSNNLPTLSGSKRSRDRTSPSYCSSSNEVQKKRYRNNDILSSLSSSMLMSTPKRSLLNSDSTPAKVIHLDRDQDQTTDTHERSTPDCASSVKQRPTESSRVGTSNSDLPLHRPMDHIKPVIKSVSDGYVPKPDTSKAPKLTLFNREYSKIPVSSERTKNPDDDDDYSVSFVKPKAKTSTLFSGSKNRDHQSKLQLMLSFLRGDDSKDEVDSVKSSKVADDKKSNEKSNEKDEKDEPKVSVSSPSSANLSTTTSVTFSTATTTSVLNAPSDAIKTSAIEVKPPIKEANEIPKEPEKVSTPSSINLIPVTSTPVTALPVSSAAQSEEKSSIPIRTVTFNLSPVQTTTAAPISLSQAISTSSDSVPRLGGFCFSATSPSFTLPTVAKPAIIATTATAAAAAAAENSSIPQNSTDSQKSTPTISFGLPQPAGNNTTLPSFGTAVFGGANALATKPATNTESLQSNQTTSAPPAFSFGIPVAKPTLASNTSGGFGILSASTTASTATATATTTPSMFTFGGTANTTNPAANSVANPVANLAQTPAFGSSAPTTSAPAFGFNSPVAAASTTTTSLPTLNQSKPSFSFGNTTSTNKPETSAFQFGNSTSTKVPVMSFGSAATTTSATPLFGSAVTAASATPLFGNINTANTTANTAATTQSAFTFTPNNLAVDTKPLQFGTPTAPTTQPTGLGAFSSPTPAFGQGNSAPPPPYGQTPTFGSLTNTPATTTSSTNLFGNASTPQTQNTSIFGSNSSTPSARVENTFGIPSNQNSPAPPAFGSNQNQPSAFGSGMNPPAFGSTGNSVFGSGAVTQNQPTFGSGSSVFSTPTTTQANNNAFGSSGVFTFGQNSAQSAANAPAPQGMFGSPSTNTTASAPFVFGQSNNNSNTATPSQSPAPGIFGAKPADGLNANSALSAPPSFGGSSPAFNFNAAKPNTGFSFSASNTPAANVPAFGSNSSTPPQFGSAASPPQFGSTATPSQFGSTNGLGTAFSFNAPNNSADTSKPFAFGGPATAPAATAASFSFNAPNQTPPPNAFQFNAQQPAATNIFSIGPGSGTNTTKTGRPMRTATRRIK